MPALPFPELPLPEPPLPAPPFPVPACADLLAAAPPATPAAPAAAAFLPELSFFAVSFSLGCSSAFCFSAFFLSECF
ncbi:hypothetical protein [Staphylococcus simulans]|uniref:hypothetical protein n=1 Tax=Staphylococcus simulans TaxID=1286 RepID=UPI000D0347B9|nr:hypothetical protein [Staphylococcus simulans]